MKLSDVETFEYTPFSAPKGALYITPPGGPTQSNPTFAVLNLSKTVAYWIGAVADYDDDNGNDYDDDSVSEDGDGDDEYHGSWWWAC